MAGGEGGRAPPRRRPQAAARCRPGALLEPEELARSPIAADWFKRVATIMAEIAYASNEQGAPVAGIRASASRPSR
jgi:hypothetical protein